MAIIFILITIFLLAWYLGFFFYTFFSKSDEVETPVHKKVKITVLIPFRNEKKNLERSFKALSEQSMPNTDHEVIYINDHSEDGGNELISDLISQCDRPFKLLSLDEGKFSKKEALKYGIQEASGELIVTTDADTVVGADWLLNISEHYQKTSSSFIIMPVKVKSSYSLSSTFQRLEFMSLQYATRTFAQRGNAILCNGANLAFEKDLFYKLGGYQGNEHFASGDDFFLLMKMRKYDKKKISFLDDHNVIATVDPEASISHFLSQRIRWASKTKHAGSWSVLLVGLMNSLIVIYMALISFLELEFSIHTFPILTNVYFFIKLMGDFLMLNQEKKHLKDRFNFVSFYLTFIIYPFYISLIFVMSLFSFTTWKGRKI